MKRKDYFVVIILVVAIALVIVYEIGILASQAYSLRV